MNINFRAKSKTEFDPQDNKLHFRNRNANTTYKKCVPLLDSLSAGYIIPLWADVMIEQNNGFPEIYWKTHSDIFLIHGEFSREIPAPEGYDQIVYKYLNCWIPQTPKGYSCLITSPLGYNNLPFHAVPAIVDTDRSTLELIFPMWVKKGFEGIVEKGTPLVQIIPFKRDDWESTFDYYEDGQYYSIIEEKNFNSTMIGHYLKNHHSKKKFK